MRLFDLLETVSRRGVYLALLTEYPAALDRVLSVLGATRWGGGYLIRHPQLLDELLDDEAIASPFDWPAFRTHCAHDLPRPTAPSNRWTCCGTPSTRKYSGSC